MNLVYLLDTHALVQWQRRERLSPRLSEQLDRAAEAQRLFVATVSFWEVAFLVKKGRLVLNDVEAWVSDITHNSGVRTIDPFPEEMVASVSLPDLHSDPFDRLLIAVARRRGLSIVTADALISQYDVAAVWEE